VITSYKLKYLENEKEDELTKTFARFSGCGKSGGCGMYRQQL
jgi:hypothetical protein